MYEGASTGTMTSGYVQRIAPPEGVRLNRDGTIFASGPADVAPVRPVPHALGNCAAQVNELHDAIGEMERRLASVLLPTPPQATGNAEKNVTAQLRCDLGERLDQVSVGIVAARNRVAALLDRLEV